MHRFPRCVWVLVLQSPERFSQAVLSECPPRVTPILIYIAPLELQPEITSQTPQPVLLGGISFLIYKINKHQRHLSSQHCPPSPLLSATPRLRLLWRSLMRFSNEVFNYHLEAKHPGAVPQPEQVNPEGVGLDENHKSWLFLKLFFFFALSQWQNWDLLLERM